MDTISAETASAKRIGDLVRGQRTFMAFQTDDLQGWAFGPVFSRNTPGLCRWIRQLCNVEPRFEQHLLQQPQAYAHLLALTRLIHGADGASIATYRLMAGRLMHSDQLALAAGLVGRHAEDLIRLVARMSVPAWPDGAYRRLLQRLCDDVAGVALASLAVVGPDELAAMSEIPPAFLSKEMLRIARDADGLNELASMLALLPAGMRHGMVSARLMDDYRQLTALDQLWPWVRDCWRATPFPAPPHAGGGSWRPIVSYVDLEPMAPKLIEYEAVWVPLVFDGSAYFYRVNVAAENGVLYVVKASEERWEVVGYVSERSDSNPADLSPISAMLSATPFLY